MSIHRSLNLEPFIQSKCVTMQYDTQNTYYNPGSLPSQAYPQQIPVQSSTSNMHRSDQFSSYGHPYYASEVLSQHASHAPSPFIRQPHASSQPQHTRSGPYPLQARNYYPSQTSGHYSPQASHPSSHAQALHTQQLRYPASDPQSLGSFLRPPRESTQHPSQGYPAPASAPHTHPTHTPPLHPSQTPGSFLRPPRESTQHPSQGYPAPASAPHTHPTHTPPLHPSQTPVWYPSQPSVPFARPLHASNQYPSYPTAPDFNSHGVSTQHPLQSHRIYIEQPHANGTSPHPDQGPSRPFKDPGFAGTGSAQRGQIVDDQTRHRTASARAHFAPRDVPYDTTTRANIPPNPPASRARSLNPHCLPKVSNPSSRSVRQPEVLEDSLPPPNASTGHTRSTSVNAPPNGDEEASAKLSQPDPEVEQRNVVLPDGQGDGDAPSKRQQGFMPPLDLGPTATYEDVVSLWEKLSTEDHETVAQIEREMEQEWRDAANKMDVDPPRLFTIGSSGPKTKQDPKTRRKRANSRRPPARAPTAAPSPSDPPAAAPSAHPTNATRPHTFKTVRVEDYVSDSDREDDEDDVIPKHMKGKERAVEQEPKSPSSREHQNPTLNVRPDPPVQTYNHSSPFSAVLNAFHVMGERMERLETSMARGLKEVDVKISGLAEGPTSAKAPQNPLGHKSKGPKAAVAKLLAARNGSSTILPRTYVHPGVRESARPSSSPITIPPPVPPPFGDSRQPRPAFVQASPGFSSAPHPNQYPTANPVPPPANAGRPGVRGAPHPTPVAPPGYPIDYSGERFPRYSMPTQMPQGGTSAAPSHPPSTQIEVDLSAEELEALSKLCRKYVRHHLWIELLRIKGPAQLHERCPPLTDDEFERYMRTKERVINADNFRIDFTRGWGRCAFNAEARNFFARHFVLSVQGGMYQNPPLPAHWVTETLIEKVLDKVMIHVTRKYNEHSKAPTVHQQAKELRDMERKRANTRRDMASLFKWRLETLVKLRLDHHLVLFTDLEAAHLSSDEPAFGTDDRQSQFKLYYIIEAAWQSRDFKKFVHALDRWYLYHSRPKVGTKQRGGNLPRVREALPKGKARVADSIAPRGLWRNCYDEDWLKNLKVSEREDLNMRDEDYDFTLPSPPPIPDEFLARRGTAASSNTRQSASAGECTDTGTSSFHTQQGAAGSGTNHHSSTVPPASSTSFLAEVVTSCPAAAASSVLASTNAPGASSVPPLSLPHGPSA